LEFIKLIIFMKKITRIALVGFMALSSIFLFNNQVRAELTPCLDNYVYPGPGLVHLSPCTVNIDMVDGAGNVPINVMLVDQNSGYGGYTGYEIEQPTGFPEYGLSKNVSSGVIVGQTSIGFTAIDSVLAASGTQPRIYNGKVDIHLFRGTSLPDGNNVTLYINIKVYPAGSTIPPKTNVNPTLSAISVVSTSEDYVSGDGFSPDGWADWKLNFNLAANSEKSIRRITIANNWGHGNYGSIDAWSTGLAAAYPLDGMPVYPLLVTSGGYTLSLRGDIIPISNIQNQTYTLYAPVGPSGPAWTGGNLFVEFTDGTRITADLPASNAKPINKPSIKTITPTLALVGTQVTLTGVFPDVNSIRLTPSPSGNGYQAISPVFSPDSTHLDFSIPNEYSSFNGNVAVTVTDSKGQISNSQSLNIVMSTSTNQIVSRLDPSSPPARTAIISPTTVTDNVVLGVFDFKSQNKDATLRSIKFKVWTSTSTVQTTFNTIKIKVGSTTYYPSSIAQSGAYAVVTYTNLAVPMPASQFVPIIVYGTVAPDRTGVMNGARVAVNILASNSTVYADDATFTQVPVAQTELTSSDLTFATAATKSITLNKLVLSSSYHVGDIIPIKWSSTNVNNVVINLMNYKGLSVVRFIASSTASVGQYNWTVPSNIDFNYDTIYTIAVSDAATPSIISKSGKIELLPATPNASPVAISNQVTSFVPLVTPNGTTGGNATFAFTLTAGSNPIYISRTASGVMTLVPVGMTVSINSVTAEPAGVSGDSNSSFVIPAGTSRRFTYNAFLDNSNGTTGQKLVSIQSIIYGMTAANPNGYQISSGLDNLKLSVNLNSNGTPPPVTALSARLTVEGQHTYTYTVGQTNHIAWLGSGPSGTVYSSYSKANDVGKCGEGAWVANNAQGTSNTYLTGQWAGCTWTVTYVATNPATGQSVQDSVTVSVVSQSTPPPTSTTTSYYPSNYGAAIINALTRLLGL
jgi:hypothetical protein